MLERIGAAVTYAVQSGIRVGYFGVDSTRAEPDFYDAAYGKATEAGASEVVVADTIGVAGPEAVGELVEHTRELVGPTVPVHFHGHNDFGLATANAVAAVRAGAPWIHGTVNGMGERAGNANIAEVALALRALYGMETALDLTRMRTLADRVRELSGYELEPWKPLVGENLFRRESGAVASQFHDPPSIEPYSSELVGAERSIVLGKKSGRTRSGSNARSWGSTCPKARTPTCSPGSNRSAPASAASSPTRSSVSSSWKETREPSPRARQPTGPTPCTGLQPHRDRAGHEGRPLRRPARHRTGLLLVADDLHGQTVGAMRNLGQPCAPPGSAGTTSCAARSTPRSRPSTRRSRAIDEVTGGADHPAQTIVGITGLAVPGCLIEIESTAVLA